MSSYSEQSHFNLSTFVLFCSGRSDSSIGTRVELTLTNGPSGSYSLAIQPTTEGPVKMKDLTEAYAIADTGNPLSMYQLYTRLATLQLDRVIRDFANVGAGPLLGSLGLTKTSTFAHWYFQHQAQEQRQKDREISGMTTGVDLFAYQSWQKVLNLEAESEFPAPAT